MAFKMRSDMLVFSEGQENLMSSPSVCQKCQVPLVIVFGLGWSFKHKRMILFHAQCPKCFISTPLIFLDGDPLPDPFEKKHGKPISRPTSKRRKERSRKEIREENSQTDGSETPS